MSRDKHGELAGLNVVLPRSPDRAAAMTAELESRGAAVALLPLIDFQFPADTSELDAALGSLRSGRFAWVIFTSVTTVLAMVRRCAALGVPPASAVPAGTRIAAVGTGTRRALEDIGLAVDLMPEGDHSARGLAETWPHPQGWDPEGGCLRILLPQADLADPALRENLTSLGWDVRAVTAYCTVDHPAPGVRFTPAADAGAAGTPPLITARDFLDAAPAGPRAVVLTSPSIVRRFLRLCTPVPAGTLLVAIGDSTAAQMAELDCPADAVAAQPTPEGIAQALVVAMSKGATN